MWTSYLIVPRQWIWPYTASNTGGTGFPIIDVPASAWPKEMLGFGDLLPNEDPSKLDYLEEIRKLIEGSGAA